LARATLVLGDKEGNYEVEAISPLSQTGIPAKFTTYADGMGVYLDADGQFSTRKPVDDLPRFVPGSDLDTGASVLITEEIGQEITLWVGPSTDGSFTAAFESVSRYPGIAMNDPIENANTDPDMVFGDGSLDPVTETFTKQRKWVSIPLVVRDYAAQATIRITRPRPDGQPPLVRRVQIPMDKDGNGLPDAGWEALTLPDNSVLPFVDSRGIGSALDDFDGNPSGPSKAGDGLSAYEEYRGFVVGGTHFRLHPFVRDLFVDADDLVSRDMFGELPFRITYVGDGDTLNEDIPRTTDSTLKTMPTSGLLTRVRPVINPNRTGVPGARGSGQRALRVIYQKDLPPTKRFERATEIRYYENYLTGVGGFAFPETFHNFDVTNWMCDEEFPEPCNRVSYGSPNETVFVEVYPKLFENSGIATLDFANHVVGCDSSELPSPS
jgi:hypothetical protein